MQKVLEKSCEKVIIGAWSVPLSQVLSDEGCRRLKDLGLDFIYLDIGARHEYAQQALDQCRKYGLGLLPLMQRPPTRRWIATGRCRTPFRTMWLIPLCGGTVLRDEPGIYDLPRLGLLAKSLSSVQR